MTLGRSTFMRWTAVFAWIIVIFILSTDAFSEAHTTATLFTPSVGFAIRKFAHWSEYFVLAVLLVRALNSKPVGLIPKQRILIAVLFAAVYAAIDEWHQSFVPSRDARIRDVFIDVTGALCGSLFLYAYAAIKQVKAVLKRLH